MGHAQRAGRSNDRQIEQAYRYGMGRWQGCNWRTDYGPSRLNLIAMRSGEALRVAQVTGGKEAENWLGAADWLTEVEAAAARAEAAARQALARARLGDFAAALAHAEQACCLESRYHDLQVWRPLRDAVLAALRPTTPADAPGLASATPDVAGALQHTH